MIQAITPLAGTQHWRSLLFLHWPVPVEVLRPLVPGELELDLHDGVAYVGLVPFVMREVRSRRWPGWMKFDFLETNVRTYVTHRGRSGVYFFSLDANSRLAVHGARLSWGLPYFHARMGISTENGQVRYVSRRRDGAGVEVQYEPGEWLGPSQPGTLEYFLLERYLLFVRRRGQILAGRVEHLPYPAQRAVVYHCQQTLVAAAGLPAVNGLPSLAHYASGVDVDIYSLRPTGADRRYNR